MSDYIKREDAYNKICSVCYLHGHCYECHFNDDNGGCELKDFITDIPSADVVERKRGEWVQISPAKIYECSVCEGNVMTDDIDLYWYCHQCGADMRGGDK